MEFFVQNAAKFIEQWLRRDDNVVTNAMFQQVAADAARDERRDQHIRIEQQLHETRLNTSSSVKIP